MKSNLEKDENIELVKQLNYYLFFWPIFLFSSLVFIICGFLYLRYTSPTYETFATVQIKKSSSDLSSFLTKTTQTFFFSLMHPYLKKQIFFLNLY